jgi:hypothetical protein
VLCFARDKAISEKGRAGGTGTRCDNAIRIPKRPIIVGALSSRRMNSGVPKHQSSSHGDLDTQAQHHPVLQSILACNAVPQGGRIYDRQATNRRYDPCIKAASLQA